MLRKILLSAAAAGFAQAVLAASPAEDPGPAPAGVYVADPAHTSVTWSLMHSGLSHWTARFVNAQATLDWKPEDPTASTLRVEIDPGSVRTDFPFPEETDFDLVIATNPQFLDNAPIVFVSTAIETSDETAGGARGLVHGDLTFRGQTHPATLEVTFNGSTAAHPITQEPKVGFSATTTILRSAWGMDALIPALGDEVTLHIEVQLVPAAPAEG